MLRHFDNFLLHFIPVAEDESLVVARNGGIGYAPEMQAHDLSAPTAVDQIGQRCGAFETSVCQEYHVFARVCVEHGGYATQSRR